MRRQVDYKHLLAVAKRSGWLKAAPEDMPETEQLEQLILRQQIRATPAPRPAFACALSSWVDEVWMVWSCLPKASFVHESQKHG